MEELDGSFIVVVSKMKNVNNFFDLFVKINIISCKRMNNSYIFVKIRK